MIRFSSFLSATVLLTSCVTTPQSELATDDDAAAQIRAQGEPQPTLAAPFDDTSYEEAETSPFSMD
jgi:hypothetical protein